MNCYLGQLKKVPFSLENMLNLDQSGLKLPKALLTSKEIVYLGLKTVLKIDFIIL